MRPPPAGALQFPLAKRRRDLIQPAPPHKLPIRITALSRTRQDPEFSAVKKIETVAGHRALFRKTNDAAFPNLEKTDILYFGQAANLANARGFNRQSEERIRRYAAQGGIIVAFPPNTKQSRGRRLSWIPDPLVETEDSIEPGIDMVRGAHLHEPKTGKIRFELVSAIASARGSRIFSEPNEIELEELSAPVAWSVWSDRFAEIATVKTTGPHEGDKAAAALILPYGKGLYIVFGFGPQRTEDLQWSAPLVENILHYAALWKEQQAKQKRHAAA